MNRRAFTICVALLAAVTIGVLSLLALARGPGSESATGRVVSISAVATGKVVCVRGDDGGRARCGEVSRVDLPEGLDSVQVGRCAYIKISRDAAVKLERRTCK